MKKILFGTTALVAAGMVVGAASAAEKMKVGVSGYQQLYLMYGSQADNAGEPAANLRNHGMIKEGEVHFKASTTMDNGIKIGWESELEAESNGSARTNDENWIWLSGDFGTVHIGGIWGPSLLMSHNAPGGAPGWGDFANLAPASAPGNSTVGGPNSFAAFTFKDSKISYYSPVIGPGLKVGLSYTPELGSTQNGGQGFTADNGAGDFGTTYEAALELNTKIGKGSLGAYAVYVKSKLETVTAGAEDRIAWALGANLGMGAWSVGAGYKTDNEGVTADSDEKHYGVGGAYSMGPVKYALNYVAGTDENGGGALADDVTFLQASMAYSWGPGVTLGAGVQNTKWEDGGNVTNDENNATVVFMGTALSF